MGSSTKWQRFAEELQVMAGALECMEGTRDVRRGYGLYQKADEVATVAVDATEVSESRREWEMGWGGRDGW